MWKTWRKYIKNFVDAFSASLTKRDFRLGQNSTEPKIVALAVAIALAVAVALAVVSLLPHWLCPSFGNGVKSYIKPCGKRYPISKFANYWVCT